MRIAALLLSLSLCFSACRQPVVDAIPGITTHFPLKNSITEWFSSNEAKGNFMVITLTNELSDSVIFQGSPEKWEEHLGMFMLLDIQKPALYGFYSIDTLPKEDTHIQFTALRKKDKVQKLIISLLNGQLLGFSGELVRSNMFYNSHYRIKADLTWPYFQVDGFMHLSFPERYKEISVTIKRVS